MVLKPPLPQWLGDAGGLQQGVGSLPGVSEDDGQRSRGFSPTMLHPQGKALRLGWRLPITSTVLNLIKAASF